MKKSMSIRKMTGMAMFCALAYLCMLVFRIKVQYLTFDIKDTILAISALIYGPVCGVVSSALVAVIECFTVSDTGWYGLIMNFLSSASFAGACGIVYKYKRDFSGAITGICVAVLCMTSVMLLANCFITPLYAKSVGFPFDLSGALPTLLLPFNLSKSVLNAALTMVIYKPFTNAMKKANLLSKSEYQSYGLNKRTVVMIIVSILLIAVAISIFFFVLKGNFELIRKV